MRLVILLGSGASVGAGMPRVAKITEQVLSGHNVLCSGSDFHLRTELPTHHQMFNERLGPILAFVREIKRLCDDYFASQDKSRVTNYEDIAYVARQIDDGIMSEYENPALLPLNERYVPRHGESLRDLQGVAAASADYIQDIVRDMLGPAPEDFAYLAPILDAFNDTGVEQLDLATLNVSSAPRGPIALCLPAPPMRRDFAVRLFCDKPSRLRPGYLTDRFMADTARPFLPP